MSTRDLLETLHQRGYAVDIRGPRSTPDHRHAITAHLDGRADIRTAHLHLDVALAQAVMAIPGWRPRLPGGKARAETYADAAYRREQDDHVRTGREL